MSFNPPRPYALQGTAAVDGTGNAAVVWLENGAGLANGDAYRAGMTYSPAGGWGPCTFVSDSMTEVSPGDPIVESTGPGTWGTVYFDSATQIQYIANP